MADTSIVVTVGWAVLAMRLKAVPGNELINALNMWIIVNRWAVVCLCTIYNILFMLVFFNFVSVKPTKFNSTV